MEEHGGKNTKIQRLFLYANKIQIISMGTFDGLTELTILNLEHNPLTIYIAVQ
jgi:hypothetical protein